MYSIREVDYPEWERYQKRCLRVNMLQCWQYGAAKEKIGRWCVAHFLVVDSNHDPVALAQFLFKKFSLLAGIARMNRGPLIIGDMDSDREKIIPDIIRALLKEAIRRRWWLVQIAPELHYSEVSIQSLRNLGLKQIDVAPWESGLLSLFPSDADLLKHLNGKWRNCLRKGLRMGDRIISSKGNGREFEILVKNYQKLQQDKGFFGIPNSLIHALSEQTGDEWQLTLFYAIENGLGGVDESIGMLMSVRHGDTSTYLIGSTNDKGRKHQTNYVLLWKAILEAKENGCQWFDIGGLNKTTPKGIAHFKRGLNSEYYSLVGEWRMLLFPWKTI